jgi:hypothetical protein
MNTIAYLGLFGSGGECSMMRALALFEQARRYSEPRDSDFMHYRFDEPGGLRGVYKHNRNGSLAAFEVDPSTHALRYAYALDY